MNDSFPSHSSLDIPADRHQPHEGFNIQDPVISSITTYTSKGVLPSERNTPMPSLQIEPSNQTNRTPLIGPEINKGADGNEEADRHEYILNKEILFKSLLYYTFYYFFGLWILLPILKCFPKCCEEWHLVRNLDHRTHWLELMVIFICLPVPFGFFSFLWEDLEILMPLVIGLWINTIFVIVSQAVIVAYTNEKASKLI